MYNNQKENEWELRKRLRLEQVRQQSKEFAHELRNKVFNEQKLKLKEIEETKQTEHKNWQRKSLNELNKEYIECLKNVGAAQANAIIGNRNFIEKKSMKPAQQDNICFGQKGSSKLEKLFPAVIVPARTTASLVSKPKYIKQASTKVRGEKSGNKKKQTDTRTEKHTASHEALDLVESDINNGMIEINPTPQNTTLETKKITEIAPEFQSKPHFSEISNLLKKSSLSKENKENDMVVPGFDSKPHFSQISNLLKKNPALDNKPHFSQVSNLLKQRKACQERITTTTDIDFKETAEIEDLKRRPSVVSFKSTKDALSVPQDGASEVFRQPMGLSKSQTSGGRFSNEFRQPLVETKVQMYDNRTKFAKEYVPQQSLTQRTSTNRDSPNAMELAYQENIRIQEHLNSVDERLQKDLQRGEDAIEREKLVRKYKTLLTELEKLSTEEKTLKTYIHAHQPPQYEPKMPNLRDFFEKRTIITSSEVRKKNSNYINVASIRSTSSSRSEDSRKSITLDYEESLILENLSESNINDGTLHRFANKASPMISGKSVRNPEIRTNVTNDVDRTVKAPTDNSNGKLFDIPIKITIQIQQSNIPEPEKMTSKEANLRLSQLESNSSSLTEYRSLPKTFASSKRPPTEQILSGISKPSQKFENQNYQQIVKEAELECYIRRLLQMSKESVDELPSLTDLSSVRESIVETSSNIDETKHSIVQNAKTNEKSIQFENRACPKDKTEFSDSSKCLSMITESTKKRTNASIQKATSYSILSNSSGNGKDMSNQFNVLSQNCNQRIIELTDLMSKVRIERQQILERTSYSSGIATVPNNSTEYHELPSRLLLVNQKLSSPLKKIENKSQHEFPTIIETGKTVIQSKLENSPTMNVDKIIDEVFTRSTSDPKIEIVSYQSEEKLEETPHPSDSEESLLDVYAELKRRNILPSGLKKLGTLSEYRKISPKPLQSNDDESQNSIATQSLLSISSSINFNRRSLLAHSVSSNEKSSSSTSSSLSKPALNLKEFLERELNKKNSSSDSESSSKQRDNDKVHRTSTPLTKHSSLKSLYLSIDAKSNLFSGESQMSSVKSNTTTSTWESA